MSLQAKIRGALKEAMIEKDQTKLDTLRAALAAFTNEAISLGKSPQEELSDDQAITVIKRLIKQRKDSIEQYTKAGRADLMAAEQAQIWLLEQYVPEPMSEADIHAVAVRKRNELAITDKSKMGILIGAVVKEIGTQADGSVVKKIVEGLWEQY